MSELPEDLVEISTDTWRLGPYMILVDDLGYSLHVLVEKRPWNRAAYLTAGRMLSMHDTLAEAEAEARRLMSRRGKIKSYFGRAAKEGR